MIPPATPARGLPEPTAARRAVTLTVVVLVASAAACRPGGDPGAGGAGPAPPRSMGGVVATEAPEIQIVRTLYPLNSYSRLIGRPAPPLDVAHWLAPESAECGPVATFEPGRVYVLVFWASWCARCREALPLLGGLAGRFPRGSVTLVGVSHEDPEDVRRFLATPAADTRSTAPCCLAADPDESVHRDYMEAVDETGIPTAFVVGPAGLVDWIGHPVDLEGPLDAIVAGRWDREAFLARRRKIEGVRTRMAAIVEEACGPRARTAVADFEAFVTERRDDAADLNEMGWLVYEFGLGKPLPADLPATAVAAVKRSLDIDPENAHTLDTLAHLQAMRGHYDDAIATQTRAVEKGGPAATRMAEYLEELRSLPSSE